MNINYLILMAVLLAGFGFLLLRYESLRKKIVNGIYLLCGGLALYVVESATHEQPFQNTLLAVVVLYLIPITIDGLVSAGKAIDFDRPIPENLIAKNVDE